MIRSLVEGSGRVPVEDRAAESRALDRVTVTAPGDVPAGQYKLEAARARLPEKRNCALVKTAVVFHLTDHGIRVLRAVQPQEDLADQSLLFGAKVRADSGFGNQPVVVDFGPQWIVEGKDAQLPLRFVQAAKELPHASFWRSGSRRLGRPGGELSRGSRDPSQRRRGAAEFPAIPEL